MLFNSNYRCRTENIWASNNPMGIEINMGYYALCHCICTDVEPSEALLRWCGLRFDRQKPRKPYTPRPYVAHNGEIDSKIIQIYKENPSLKNNEIAKMVSRSNGTVSKVLRSVGIKRSRWDFRKEVKK